MAGSPEGLIETPGQPASRVPGADVLSDILRSIRLSGSLQFCVMPSGSWQTPAGKMRGLPVDAIPFHIVVKGSCWVRRKDEDRRELVEGDLVAFPFDAGHALGVGEGGKVIVPVDDLPPKPWREIPILRYGEQADVRLLCGYLQCGAISFGPLRNALPRLLHVRTKDVEGAGWLRATIDQVVAEVDRPRTGGSSLLERLTEVMFVELLRHEILAASPGSVGWLAALADPPLARCLAVIHGEPSRDWSVQDLAAASGLSRSSLAERFESVLATAPMRYVRDWRLFLASVALSTTSQAVAAIAYDAGYGTEAAFNRAFSRAYGAPPAAWRQKARQA